MNRINIPVHCIIYFEIQGKQYPDCWFKVNGVSGIKPMRYTLYWFQKCFDIHVIDFQIFFLDTQWRNFFKHWSMQEITKRAAIIHIDIPGQEDDAPDLPAE